jgi:outer membrane protein OmpA-like peptidoglycan-associated protein
MTLQRPLSRRSSEDHWIPLSDLMTGLMMMFLVIAIMFMIKVEREAKQAELQARQIATQAETIKAIAILYGDVRAKIYDEMFRAFKDDLPVWHAALARDLSIRFEEPSVQFDIGQSVLKPEFSKILSNFFPRYVRILNSEQFRNEIEEVRIEGHTSSVWKNMAAEPAYYENMRLSQERARAVLQYVFGLPDARDQLGWLVPRVTANGLSSSRRLIVGDREDYIGSQRVEFKVRTRAEDKLAEIAKSTRK